jgi:hypothetical protein
MIVWATLTFNPGERHTERDHDVTGYDDQGAQGKTTDRLREVEENKL